MVLPLELQAELVKMRRNPSEYNVSDTLYRCQFCGEGKTALATIRGESQVGSWCPRHGWLFFDSVKCPPTERLRPSEVEDARLRERRQREYAERKQEHKQSC